MTKKNNWVLTATITAAFVATSVLAAPSESQLLEQAKITKSQAEKIAMAKVPNARIQSAEIENEHHALVWSFDMVQSGSKDITEVLVNAKTGGIISVTKENTAAQAAEARADAAQKH